MLDKTPEGEAKKHKNILGVTLTQSAHPNAKRKGANYFISFLTDGLVLRDVSLLGGESDAHLGDGSPI